MNFFIIISFWIAIYVYMAYSLQKIAEKTSTSNGWWAWIPLLNIFLVIKIAVKPWWWFFLLLIPFVNIVVAIILWMEIAKKRNKPAWVGILMIVPIVNLAIPGYLAFSGDGALDGADQSPNIKNPM